CWPTSGNFQSRKISVESALLSAAAGTGSEFIFSKDRRADTAASTPSFVDLDNKLAVRINVAAVHAVCVKWQSYRAVFIDGNQTAAAAKLLNRIQSRLCRFPQFHAAIFHQR